MWLNILSFNSRRKCAFNVFTHEPTRIIFLLSHNINFIEKIIQIINNSVFFIREGLDKTLYNYDVRTT